MAFLVTDKSKCKQKRSTKRITEAQFIERAKVVHGNYYDYGNCEFNGTSKKVNIMCPKHGQFTQVANNHIKGQGCPECGKAERRKGRVLTTEEFIEKATAKHGNTYTYSKTDYYNSETLVTITCPVHGDFKQTPHSHLKGSGCQKCGYERITKHNSEFSTGWSYTDWERAGKNSEHFEAYSVYVIQCTGNDEKFIKVGKTFTSVAKRFNNGGMPYKYKILTQVYGKNAYATSVLEDKVKRAFKDHKYLPKRDFQGKHECISIDVVDDVIAMVEL